MTNIDLYRLHHLCEVVFIKDFDFPPNKELNIIAPNFSGRDFKDGDSLYFLNIEYINENTLRNAINDTFNFTTSNIITYPIPVFSFKSGIADYIELRSDYRNRKIISILA